MRRTNPVFNRINKIMIIIQVIMFVLLIRE